jgi:site-specific DNA-methyltransferase (cytosine-N4-specific)
MRNIVSSQSSPASNFAAQRAVFTTPLGQAILGDSRNVLATLPPESVDLVMTSPPFALLREKEYGNHDQSAYVDWLCDFGPEVRRVLKPAGSFVLDLGGAYQRGVPVRSLYNYRVLIKFVDEHGFHLAEEFFWHNPSKLPSPIEWVNKRKLRAKDSVNTVWWFSKTEWPKADVSRVLVPYSDRMKTLLKNAEGFYKPKERPSGHDIGSGFGKDNGGAIPSNLLQFANSESNSAYLRLCKETGVAPHPARFPRALPQFFIQFLTDPGDLVVDIFGGSCTTGEAAEQLGRRWVTIDLNMDYVKAGSFRFLTDRDSTTVRRAVERMEAGEHLAIEPMQPELL